LEEKAMNERPGYGDAEAKRIIERAAEIDAKQGHQLDAPALREIAAGWHLIKRFRSTSRRQ
jgi:hypothetical protein